MLESPLPELLGDFCFITELRIGALMEVNLQGTGLLDLKRQMLFKQNLESNPRAYYFHFFTLF